MSVPSVNFLRYTPTVSPSRVSQVQNPVRGTGVWIAPANGGHFVSLLAMIHRDIGRSEVFGQRLLADLSINLWPSRVHTRIRRAVVRNFHNSRTRGQ